MWFSVSRTNHRPCTRYKHMHSCFNNERFPCFTVPPFSYQLRHLCVQQVSCWVPHWDRTCNWSAPWKHRPCQCPTGWKVDAYCPPTLPASPMAITKRARRDRKCCSMGKVKRLIQLRQPPFMRIRSIWFFDWFNLYSSFFSTLFSDPNTESLKSDTDSGRICALWCDFFRRMTSAPIIALVPTR